MPAYNPYFQLMKTQVTGLWSELIEENLARTRPAAVYLEKPESIDENLKDGKLDAADSSRVRLLAVRVSSYLALSGGININW